MSYRNQPGDVAAHPSAGGTTPAGKDSSNCEDALGKPSRFSRAVPGAATPDAKEELTKTRDEQLGTNIELAWTRYGHDVKNPKVTPTFKNNFNNPTDK